MINTQLHAKPHFQGSHTSSPAIASSGAMLWAALSSGICLELSAIISWKDGRSLLSYTFSFFTLVFFLGGEYSQTLSERVRNMFPIEVGGVVHHKETPALGGTIIRMWIQIVESQEQVKRGISSIKKGISGCSGLVSHCVSNGSHTPGSFCFTLTWALEGIFIQLSLITYSWSWMWRVFSSCPELGFGVWT